MRQTILKLLPKSEFLRNVGILTGGTLFAQVVMVLALPVLTRLYSPHDFSLLAIYTSIVGLIMVASSLRFNVAIPIPERDEDAMNLLVLSLLAAVLCSAFLALPVLIAPRFTAGLFGRTDFTPYLWMVPLGVLVASTYDALQYWASRKKRFGLITRTRVTRAIGGAGVQLGIGFYNATPFGLNFGHMLYGALGSFGLVRAMVATPVDRMALRATSVGGLLRTGSQYRRFPIYSVPESLFNTAGIEIPILMVAALAAGPEAGFLMLAIRVMGLPMGMLGGSVAQVYLAEAPKKLADGTLGAFTLRTMWALFKIGAPPLLAVGLLAPFLFPMVFGAEWARSGVIVAWLTPWFILQFVSSPVSMVLHITDRLFLAMCLQLVGAVLRIGCVIFAWKYTPSLLTEIFALSGTLFYLIYSVLLLLIVRRILK